MHVNPAQAALVPLLVLLSLGAAAHAADDAVELLERMGRAAEELNYEGTFVYSSGNRIETMEIVHGIVDGARRERLLSLTGERREIIRNENELICIWPDSQAMVMEPRRARPGLPTTLPSGATESIDASYRLRLERKRHRVADLKCRDLVLAPIDNYRYGHRYCIEDRTALPLRAEMYDPTDGRVIERFMFTSIRFPDGIPPARFEPVTGGEGFRVLRIETERLRDEGNPDPAWRIQAPPGFVLTRNANRRMLKGRAPVQHMVVSDGLASVSVFIAEAGARKPRPPRSDLGPIHAVNVTQGRYDITVVGEVPEATVRLIADSITYEQSP